MSSQNVEIVRSATEAFNRGDLDGWRARFDPDIVWYAMPDEPEPGPFQGLNQVQAMAGRWMELLSDFRIEVKEYIDAGDYVVVPARMHGRHPDSDADVTVDEVYVNKCGSGRIVEVREFRTTEEALAALGLSKHNAGKVGSENVDVVRKAIWAFENDADAFRSMQSSDGVWFPFEDNYSPSYGIEGAMRIRSQWLDAWDEYRSEVEDVVAEGENVVVSLHVIGRGKASRAPVDVRIHFHFKVRDGKIVYTYEHLDKAAALEAAGLGAPR